MEQLSTLFAVCLVTGYFILCMMDAIMSEIASSDVENLIFSERCCGEYGCFKADPACDATKLLPLCQKEMKVKLYLWTRENPKNEDTIIVENKDSLKSSHFLPTRTTFFYIHGFSGTGKDLYVKDTKDNFLEKLDCNVMAVDWSKGAISIHDQAASNTRVVATVIAELIRFMMETYGDELGRIHLVGHSLGAQVAGLVGKRLNGTLYRITGLDPAKKSFRNCPSWARLNTTDALFIDVLHTGIDDLGIPTPLGHLDIFVNGGKNQPACRGPLPFFVDPRFLLFCDHMMSTIYFSRSIVDPKPDIAYVCDNEDFDKGNCPKECNQHNSNCAPIGYPADVWRNNAKDSPIIMYVRTSDA